MKSKLSLIILPAVGIFFGTAGWASPQMNCTINRPGISDEESATVPFSTPYIREYSDKIKLFIGFYDGQMQIILKDMQATDPHASGLASARTDYKNTDLVLASLRWHLDVHCKRME